MKRAAIIIKERYQQYEGLRTGVGLLLENISVQMFVLRHEVEKTDRAYHDLLKMMDEMNGERYSDNTANVACHGFRPITMADVALKISDADVVIPF